MYYLPPPSRVIFREPLGLSPEWRPLGEPTLDPGLVRSPRQNLQRSARAVSISPRACLFRDIFSLSGWRLNSETEAWRSGSLEAQSLASRLIARDLLNSSLHLTRQDCTVCATRSKMWSILASSAASCLEAWSSAPTLQLSQDSCRRDSKVGGSSWQDLASARGLQFLGFSRKAFLRKGFSGGFERGLLRYSATETVSFIQIEPTAAGLQNQMQKKKSQLFLSNSLEHMLFPVPPRLTLQAIISLMPALAFETNLTLPKYKELTHKAFGQELEGLWLIAKGESEKFEPRLLGVLLFLQLVNSRHETSSSGFNQSFKIQRSSYSPLSSPRTRSNRSLFFTNEQNQIFQFVKGNLKTFLRLVSSDPTTEIVNITQAEFNLLSVLFRLERGKTLAQSSGIFGPSPKMSLLTLHQHLQTRLSAAESQVQVLQNLQFITTIKDAGFGDQDVRIVNCYNSFIYINSPVNSVHILSCRSCTIFVAASSRMVYVDNCEKVTLSLACPLLRVCNSIDSSFFSCSVCPPILSGDSRGLQLGPHNAPLPELKKYLEEAGLSLSQKSINNFEAPLCLPPEEGMFSVIPPAEFEMLVLPTKDEANPDLLVLTPLQYRKEMVGRKQLLEDKTAEILGAGLTLEQLKMLNLHVQGRFKEWLVNTGKDTEINELVKLIY